MEQRCSVPHINMRLGYLCDVKLADCGTVGVPRQHRRCCLTRTSHQATQFVAFAANCQETNAPCLLVTKHGFGRDVEGVTRPPE